MKLDKDGMIVFEAAELPQVLVATRAANAANITELVRADEMIGQLRAQIEQLEKREQETCAERLRLMEEVLHLEEHLKNVPNKHTDNFPAAFYCWYEERSRLLTCPTSDAGRLSFHLGKPFGMEDEVLRLRHMLVVAGAWARTVEATFAEIRDAANSATSSNAFWYGEVAKKALQQSSGFRLAAITPDSFPMEVEEKSSIPDEAQKTSEEVLLLQGMLLRGGAWAQQAMIALHWIRRQAHADKAHGNLNATFSNYESTAHEAINAQGSEICQVCPETFMYEKKEKKA